jgi:leader peptidase (prepilin peptidase)/N-methyltransferase
MPASGLLIWSPVLAVPFVGGSLAIAIKQQCAHGSFAILACVALPLVLAGLGMTVAPMPDEVFWHALGAAVGYLALRSIALAHHALRPREGPGGGDVTLLSATGAWLGVGTLPSLVMIAAITVVACPCLAGIAGRPMRAATAVPFGPFFAAAFWLLWLYGQAWSPA